MKVLNKLLKLFCKVLAIEFDLLVLYEKRLINLKKIKKHVAIVISTTDEALKNYSDFFGADTIKIPIVCPEKFKMLKGTTTSQLVVSGRLTDHRKKIMASVNLAIAGNNFKDIKNYEQFVASNPKIDFGIKHRLTYVQSIFTKNESHKLKLLLDVYLPQSKFWKLSSPNRTLASIENGCIPVNFGNFTDHPINGVAFEADSCEKLIELCNHSTDELQFKLNNRLKSYNKLQKINLVEFNKALEHKILGIFA